METLLTNINSSFYVDIESVNGVAAFSWVLVFFFFHLIFHSRELIVRKTRMREMEPVKADLTLQHRLAIVIVLFVAVTEPIEVVMVVHVLFILVVFLRTESTLFEEFRVPTITTHSSFSVK